LNAEEKTNYHLVWRLIKREARINEGGIPMKRYPTERLNCQIGKNYVVMLIILKTISGLLIFILFTGKVIVHYYLDFKHGRSGGFLYSLISPWAYFQFYKLKVDRKFINLQRLCNRLLVLAFISLLVNIVLGVTLYLNYQ
jgi:hypothetical protein